MTRSPSAVASLLAWDAPFLPTWSGADGTAVPVRSIPARWGVTARSEVAIQLLAAAQFLFERGWFPDRALLRQAVVVRSPGGPRLCLGELPRWRLEDSPVDRRLKATHDGDASLVERAIAPLVRAIVPERWDAMRSARRGAMAWDVVPALLGVLVDGHRRPLSAAAARSLWARKLAVPTEGPCWVEEGELLRGLVEAAAAAASAEGRSVRIASGPLEEDRVVRFQADAALAGADAVVFTSIPTTGAETLRLADGAAVVWALGVFGGCPHLHVASALERGRWRPALAARALAAGAASGFATPPCAGEASGTNAGLASEHARRASAWLRSAPAGLTAAELEEVSGGSVPALEELRRLGLATERRGVWNADRITPEPDPERVRALAARLPAESPRRLVASGMDTGSWRQLETWCEAALDRARSAEVCDVALAVPGSIRLRLLGAEALLGKGRLNEAERVLDAVGDEDRDPRWHVLGAWWAELAGLPARARELLDAVPGLQVPARIAGVAALVEAQLAHRAGDREGERSNLLAARSAGGTVRTEAELLLSSLDGPDGLRRLRRQQSLDRDARARLLHLLGVAAFGRDALAAGATALRAALRTATGESPLLVGEIYSDLGVVAILQERVAAAERYLLLAEQSLTRAGSQRAVTLVRANRAVLANDRLDWRRARALIEASSVPRGDVRDGSFWLSQLELVRCHLARGDAAAARRDLARLDDGLADRRGGALFLDEARAAVSAHLALLDGNLEAAALHAAGAESSEREPVLAVVAAAEGNAPPPELTQRWGLALTARLLAAWRRSDIAAAERVLGASFSTAPRESAVGLARFVAVLRHRGERPDDGWSDRLREAERILLDAELDGWAEILRPAGATNAAAVIRALDDVINAGTAAVEEERLAALAASVGGRWVEVRRGAEVLGRWGDPADDGEVAAWGGVQVRYDAAGGAVADAAMGLLVRTLSTLACGVDGGQARAPRVLVGRSSALAAIEDQIRTWAPLPAPVLVLGERGTGKELVARELHRQSGRPGRFVAVNCAAVPATLLESELFGCVRGAFSGADRDRPGLVDEAERGTLFLDEIGELPIGLQAALLRLLQENEVRPVGSARSHRVDVRFVAATNRDLEEARRGGGFRSDLYDRLAVCVIEVPPLRRRAEDVEDLAPFLVARVAQEYGRTGVRLAPEAVEVLRRCDWPGNVRELEIAIRRAVATASPGEVLGPDRFGTAVGQVRESPSDGSFAVAQEAFRTEYFLRLLESCDGNRSRAARRAGLTRQGLHYQLRRLGLMDALKD